MARCLITYFSQGGTTAQVAERIALGLSHAGYQVERFNLKDGVPPSPARYDLLGVGTPVHNYRLPLNVEDYLQGLPALAGKPAFAFTLYGSYQFDAPNALRRALAEKGAREVGLFTSHGDDLFLCYLKRGYRFSPEHPTVEDLLGAEMFGREVAARAAGAPFEPPPEQPPAPAIYRFERFVSNRHLVRHFYSRAFRLDKRECNKCGICRKGCPTANIAEGRDGYPAWGRDCILCVMCEFKCPRGGDHLCLGLADHAAVYGVQRASCGCRPGPKPRQSQIQPWPDSAGIGTNNR